MPAQWLVDLSLPTESDVMKTGEIWYLCAADYDGPVEIIDAEPVTCGGMELVLAQLANGVVAAVRRDRLVETEYCRTGWGHA